MLHLHHGCDVYSRAAFINFFFVLKCGVYSSAAFIRGRLFLICFLLSTTQVRRLFKGGIFPGVI